MPRAARLFGPFVIMCATVACSKVTHIEIQQKQPLLSTRVDRQQLVAHVMMGKSEDAKARVTWTSEDSNIIAVGPDGIIQAKSSGRAKVRATYGEIFAEVPVEAVLVEKLASDVMKVELSRTANDPVKPHIQALGAGGRPLKDRPIQLRTQNDKVCNVDGSGQFWPVEIGETIITASLEDQKLEIPCVVAK